MHQIDKRFFIVGSVMIAFVAAMLVWAFGIGDLSSDQRDILRVILPLASGFVAGSFVGALTVSTKGWLPGVLATATGGFGVYLLSAFFLFPPVTNSQPKPIEVVIMDSSELKYHPNTPGSNARLIREMIDDFRVPVHTTHELAYKGFDNDQVIIDRTPDLIIIHLTSFYDREKKGGLDLAELERSDREFQSFISLMYEKTDAKFLIYTRGLSDIDMLPAEQHAAVKRGYARQKEFISKPPIGNRAKLFEISSPNRFEDGVVKRDFKALFQSMLAIKS